VFVLVNNGAQDINARTATGVVIIDPATGDAITGPPGSGGDDTVPVVRSATLTSATGPGTTPAGCTQASFANTGVTAALVAGAQLGPGDSVTFDARGNDTLATIAYDATGTTLLVATVQ